MSKKKLKRILFVLIILIMILISPIFKVRKVVIHDDGIRNGNFDLSDFNLEKNIFLLSKSKLEESLFESGFIDSVKIEKKFFCELHLTIKWKKPLISLKSGDSYIILDHKGYVLYISENDMGLDCIEGVIVKSARIGHPVISKNDFILENAVNLYLLINENRHLYANPEIEAKLMVKKDAIIQILQPEYIINYGDGSDLQERFSKAISIYNNLYEKQVSTGIINVSRKNHYVYETWKDE